MRFHGVRSRFPALLFALCCVSFSVFGGSHPEAVDRVLSACNYAEVTQSASHAEDEDGALKVEWIAKISPSKCSLDFFRKRIWTSSRDGVQAINPQVWISIFNGTASTPLKEMEKVAKLEDCATGKLCFIYDEGACSSTDSCGAIEFRPETPVTDGDQLTVKVTYEVKEIVCINSENDKARLSLDWTSDWEPGWWVKHSTYRLCTHHPDAPCKSSVGNLGPRPCLGERASGDKRWKTSSKCGHTVEVAGALFTPYFEWSTASSTSLQCNIAEDDEQAEQETSKTSGLEDLEEAEITDNSLVPIFIAVAAFAASVVFAGIVCVLAHKVPVRRMEGSSDAKNAITFHWKDKLDIISDDTSDSTVASVRDSPKHNLRRNGGATSTPRASPIVDIGRDLEAGCAPMRDRDLSSSSRNLQSTFNASVEEDNVDIQADTHKKGKKLKGMDDLYESLTPSRRNSGRAPKQHSASPDWDVMSDASIKSTNNAHRPSQNAVIAANALRDIQMAAFPPVVSPFPKGNKRSVAPRNDTPNSNWDAMSDAVVAAAHSSHAGQCGRPSLLSLPATNELAVRSESRRSNWDVMSDMSAGDLPPSALKGRNLLNLFGETEIPCNAANGRNNMQTIGDGKAEEIASKPIIYL